MHRVFRIPRSRPLPLLVSVVLVAIATTTHSYGGPKLVPLEPNGLHGADTSPYRGMKVCLVVKDARHESVVKTQICGKMRNAFGAVLAVLALRNQESLEMLMAYSLADGLEFAGYEVVRVIPERPAALSGKGRDKPSFSKADIESAKRSLSKRARGEAKALLDLGGFDEEVSFSERPGTIAAQGGKGWTNGADAVLEVTIEGFASDIIIHAWTAEVLAWSGATLAVAPGESGVKRKLATANANGFGGGQAGGASKATYKRALDMAFRMLVNRMEAVFLSDEFYREMRAASGLAEQTD